MNGALYVSGWMYVAKNVGSEVVGVWYNGCRKQSKSCPSGDARVGGRLSESESRWGLATLTSSLLSNVRGRLNRQSFQSNCERVSCPCATIALIVTWNENSMSRRYRSFD